MTVRAKQLFDRGAVRDLEHHLCRLSKNEFVIRTIQTSGARRLLELGCGKGALTSLFIVSGYDVLGVDVSATAIRAARENFGDHFAEPAALQAASGQPYDCVYHVGTIGCVEAPLEFTRSLLRLLRPGGQLVFNAPDADACRQRRALWASTPPPDLVTLFTENFWRERFHDEADVHVHSVAMMGPERLSALRRQLAGSLEPRHAHRLREVRGDGSGQRRGARSAAGRLAEPLARFLPRLRSDYGLQIIMEKRA
jgi:SAM-dependent methyltransferase